MTRRPHHAADRAPRARRWRWPTGSRCWTRGRRRRHRHRRRARRRAARCYRALLARPGRRRRRGRGPDGAAPDRPRRTPPAAGRRRSAQRPRRHRPSRGRDARPRPGRRQRRPARRGHGARPRRRRRTRRPMAGALGGMPPTPELLGRGRALPPATTTRGCRRGPARAADPGSGLRQLLRPVRWLLSLACCWSRWTRSPTWRCPRWSGTPSTPGSRQARRRRCRAAVAARARAGRWSTGWWSRPRPWSPRAPASSCSTRCGCEDFAHLQRLGLDYYERELSGRIMTRMTTDVDALSSVPADRPGHRGGQRAHLRRRAPSRCWSSTSGWRWSCSPCCRCWSWPRWSSAGAVVARLHRGPRAGRDRQRRPAGERRRHAGRPGVPPRGAQRGGASPSAAERYRRSRLRAQRYIAMYFPFVALLSDARRGRGARASARRAVRVRHADRRRADRVPALPRAVLRARSSSSPRSSTAISRPRVGLRRIARPAAHPDLDPARRPRARGACRRAAAR